MRFALLGEHPDGLDLAGALVDSGRHQVVACTGRLTDEAVARLGGPARVGDVEEVLADPAVEAVIVAGARSVRGEQLRRALQSERAVLCVHPADEKADLGHEAAMMQADTGYPLFPILPEGLHPAFTRLAELLQSPEGLGGLQLLLFERDSTGEVLDGDPEAGERPSVPGWDVLRRLGGELAEVSSFAGGEELAPGGPVLLAGRFERGGLFQVALQPNRPAARWRLLAVGPRGQAELTFPQGWNGPAFLERAGAPEEYFPRWDAWSALVDQFERAAGPHSPALTWQDEVRMLELDEAARRSVERRRVNQMEYQEVTEEVGFKGTMTLVGCALVWVVLGLLFASAWKPWVGWLILPLLAGFVILQLFRLALPGRPQTTEARPGPPDETKPA